MDCCIFIFVILIIVVLVAFGAFFLTILLAILNVIYLLLLDMTNWIKRKIWLKTIADLPYNELQNIVSDLRTSLTQLKAIDRKLSSGISTKKGSELDNNILMFKIDTNKAKINDAEARINIIKKLLDNQQPLEDARLAREQVQRQEEIKKFTSTSDYKLVEQFVSKNTDKEKKENLPKLSLLLESKGWDLTQSELQTLIKKEGERQKLATAKARILKDNPESLKEILKSYLEYYQPYDVELNALEEILKERNLAFPNSASLQSEIEKVKKENEIEQFERGLLEEN